MIGQPFVVVSPNGPDNYGAFGPNTSGTSTAGIQEAINSVSSAGGKVFIRNGTYTMSAQVVVPSYVRLEGSSTDGTVLDFSTVSINGIVCNASTTNASSSNLRGSVSDLTIKISTTAGNAIWVICAQQYVFERLLIGGGNTAYAAILVQDTATIGTYFNSFRDINFMASSTFSTSYQFTGYNPGPNWIYGGSSICNTNAILINASQQYVYGHEIDQGVNLSASSVQIALQKGANATIYPKLYFNGDFEVSGSQTYGVVIDSNSDAIFSGNLSIAAFISQFNVQGHIYWTSMSHTTSESRQGFTASGLTPNFPASGTVIVNTLPFPVNAWITSTVGATITAFSIADINLATRSATAAVNAGQFFPLNPSDSISFTYTSQGGTTPPTWAWYGN
jgi:hypothetical protein